MTLESRLPMLSPPSQAGLRGESSGCNRREHRLAFRDQRVPRESVRGLCSKKDGRPKASDPFCRCSHGRRAKECTPRRNGCRQLFRKQIYLLAFHRRPSYRHPSKDVCSTKQPSDVRLHSDSRSRHQHRCDNHPESKSEPSRCSKPHPDPSLQSAPKSACHVCWQERPIPDSK